MIPENPLEGHKPTRTEDRRAVDDFFTGLYETLRSQARHALWRDPAAKINTNSLVNEVFLKMAGVKEFVSMPIEQRMAIAAISIRDVLVDAARKRNTQKRDALTVPLVDEPAAPELSAEDILTVDAAIEKLKSRNPAHAQLVELKFFGGFNMSEIARIRGVSKATVERDWTLLKAWLVKELRAAGSGNKGTDHE